MDTEKIRIVRIINRFNLGGPTYNVSYLSRYLPDEYETILVGGKEEAHEASSLFIPQMLGLKPIQIVWLSRSVNLKNDLRAFLEIYKIIRTHRPHIVHTHASKAGLLGRLAAICNGVPVIVHTFHGHVFQHYFSRIKTFFIILMEQLLAFFTDAVVAISPAQKNELVKRYKICRESKCHVIRLGFDLQRFLSGKEEKRTALRKKFGVSEKEVFIGIIGRMAPVKNHELFVDALDYLKKKKIPFKALVVGDGYRKEKILSLCKEKGIKTSDVERKDGTDLFFTGWMQDVSDALAALDIVCLTSRNEGTPVSLIEAQAAGKIIVSTNVGGVPDIRYSPYFYVTEKEDFSDFPLILEKATEVWKNISREEINAASEKIATEYDYSRLIKDMDGLYKQLLSKKKLFQ